MVRLRNPPINISLDPNLATPMNWTLYYTLSKNDQAIMLDRVFHNDIQSLNARRMMSRITRHQELIDLVNGPPELTRALKLQQNDQVINTLTILLRTVDNHSTSTSRTVTIIAEIVEAITVLQDNRSTLLQNNRSTL